jgi:CheY-like chemotaxis protein
MVALDHCSASLKRRVHRLLGSRIEVLWLRSSELDPVLGQCEWIEQVVLDMAIRARTALPYGGRVIMETANLELDPFSAAAESLEAGRYVMLEMTCHRQGSLAFDEPGLLCVSDFSVEDWLEQLLPQSVEILRSLGGNICEYNEPSRALTLRAFFPSAGTVIYTDGEDFSLSSTAAGDTILLVEDEGYVRDVASEILQAEGYVVITARSAAEALACFEKHGPVKLLVTDVIMPGMNGKELAVRLKALQPNLKTIYMSGYTDNPVLRRDFQAPEVAYLQKPFTLETLSAKVKEVLEGNYTQNQVDNL